MRPISSSVRAALDDAVGFEVRGRAFQAVRGAPQRLAVARVRSLGGSFRDGAGASSTNNLLISASSCAVAADARQDLIGESDSAGRSRSTAGCPAAICSTSVQSRRESSGLVRYSSMPASRHRSRSPFIACAVIAMIGTRAAGRALALADCRGRLESAHLRHLHVHQHDVERLRGRARRALRGRCWRWSPGGRGVRAGSPRAAG